MNRYQGLRVRPVNHEPGPDAAGPDGATRGALIDKKTASAAAPSSFGPGQGLTTRRPTYATKPRRNVALTVMPPIRFAGHETIVPRWVTATGAPETATRTLVGATA